MTSLARVRLVLALLPLGLLLSAGCNREGAPDTGIIVELASDLLVPDEINQVHLTAEDLQGNSLYDHIFDLGVGQNRYEFPFRVGLFPLHAASTPIHIAAVGQFNEKAVVSRSATLSFVSGKKVVLVLPLWAVCKKVTCKIAYATCKADGNCEPDAVESSQLPKYAPNQPVFGTDAFTDMSDAGATLDAAADKSVDAAASADADEDGPGSSDAAAVEVGSNANVDVLSEVPALLTPDAASEPDASLVGLTDAQAETGLVATDAPAAPSDVEPDLAEPAPDVAFDLTAPSLDVAADLAADVLTVACGGPDQRCCAGSVCTGSGCCVADICVANGATCSTGGTCAAGSCSSSASLLASTLNLGSGSVAVGQSGGVTSFTITNTGQQSSGAITVASNSAEFAVQSGTTADCVSGVTTLVAGASCTVRVVFTPSTVGVRSGLLTFSAMPGGDGRVNASGAGIAPGSLASSTSSVSFGTVALGSSSGMQTFAITNTGQESSGAITLASSSPDFVIQSGASAGCVSGTTTLAEGESCEVRVVFTPRSAGGQSAFITFSATPGGSENLSVFGTGITPASLTAGLTTSLPSFGSVIVGQSSPEASFTITNIGQQTSGAVTVASDSSEFVVQSGGLGDCVSGVTALATNTSCTVRVVFSPKLAGARTGSVSFSATPGGSAGVGTSGTGVCGSGLHDGGVGFCTSVGACTSGYHNDGTGSCVVNLSCPTDQLSDGTGTCVPMAGVTWTQQGSSRNWYSVASSADGTKLVAVVSGGYIWTSGDSGANWTQRGSSQNWYSVASSADGTKLVAVVYGGYIWTSGDSGADWTQRGSSQNWYSVASSADGTKLVAASGSNGYIWTSGDSGATWAQCQAPRGSAVASSADGTKLVAVATGSSWTSADSGATWTQTSNSGSWSSVASSADGTKLVALDNGYGSGGYIYTSVNSGAAWTKTGSQQNWSSVASSADGTKLVAVCRPAYIWTSTDSGGTWAQRESPRNWRSVASSADGTKLVAVTSGYIYTSSGPVP
jgi:hypothetical protein